MREKVARQLEESTAAFLTSSQKLPETPPESQDRAPDSKFAMLRPSQATLENPDSDHLIPVVDLVSDSEVDSEAETVIIMETYSRIRISTKRPESRIRILNDRILRASERIDISQFFWLSTPLSLSISHAIVDGNDLHPPNSS